jgi:hypothetical protein
MLTAVQEVQVGTGVIDCDVSSDGSVIAGDVSGKVVFYDGDLSEIWSVELDMPVWGASLSEKLGVAVVALADKAGFRGAAVRLDLTTGQIVRRVDLASPGWDAIIDERSQTAYVSSWGDGVLAMDLSHDGSSVFSLPGHLFGLDLVDLPEANGARLLTVTVGGVGVVGLDPATGDIAAVLLESASACYKHAFSTKADVLFVGSSTSQGSYGVRKSGLVYGARSSRSVMRDSCAVLCVEDLVVVGSLSGQLQVSRLSKPAMSIAFAEVPGACWSFRKHPLRPSVWIARGDGYLGEYLMSDFAQSPGSQLMDDIAFGPGSLAGARVFISYAREDFDQALDLYRYLRSVGCDPWMDKVNLLGGQDWKYEIERAIRASDFALVLLSPRSVSKRGFVQKEMRLALEVLDELPESEIFLIPVVLEACEVPTSLAQRHWIDLSVDEGLIRLCLSIYTGMASRRGSTGVD